MKYIHFRNLVGVSHSDEEMRAMAAEYEIEDGPGETGAMFMRPGRLSDQLPAPYPNEESSRAANGGAIPPDLSCIVKARLGAEDYIFSLLTGYYDPPAGIELLSGLHYNPFYPGGAISMARVLYDGLVDYEDGMSRNMLTFVLNCLAVFSRCLSAFSLLFAPIFSAI